MFLSRKKQMIFYNVETMKIVFKLQNLEFNSNIVL